MPAQARAVVTVAGRILLSLIFMMSALGNKIPEFSGTADYMASEGVPAARLMLVGAIVFLCSSWRTVRAPEASTAGRGRREPCAAT